MAKGHNLLQKLRFDKKVNILQTKSIFKLEIKMLENSISKSNVISCERLRAPNLKSSGFWPKPDFVRSVWDIASLLPAIPNPVVLEVLPCLPLNILNYNNLQKLTRIRTFKPPIDNQIPHIEIFKKFSKKRQAGMCWAFNNTKKRLRKIWQLHRLNSF